MTLPLWLQVLLQVAFFAIVILYVYKKLKENVLYKYNPNKWLILGMSGIVFLIPVLTTEYLKLNMSGTLWQYIDSTFFIILFLWFVDLSNGSMKKIADKKANPSTSINMQNTNNPNKPKKNKNRDSRRRK